MRRICSLLVAVIVLAGPAAGSSGSGPSPRKAFMLSLLVPGLGQAYGSGWDFTSWPVARGAGYAAFEAFAWVRQQDNLGRGLDKQTEYRAYADTNWAWNEYYCANWNGGDGAIDDDPFLLNDLPGDEHDFYLDTEPELLEFYEDIHKLQKWICGWEDYGDHYALPDNEGDELRSTPMQMHYRGMRQEQNRLMSAADHWLYGIVANHLVSAFDAYFTAKGRTEDGELSRLPRVRFGDTMTGNGAAVALVWRF